MDGTEAHVDFDAPTAPRPPDGFTTHADKKGWRHRSRTKDGGGVLKTRSRCRRSQENCAPQDARCH
jgi:ribosomal protein L34